MLPFPPDPMISPSAPGASEPSSAIRGSPAKPGCVIPSMTTGSVIVGSALVRAIVFGPVPMANRI
ncbi:MAG: hypothetical protein AUG02_01580 [Chloroflexi bacterium 13_1_20CM_2_70_9]|nr:MAG: hypothetical protein AUG02_01580 [Chloroflexi bacterium 13_1_20CM_2_70_9]